MHSLDGVNNNELHPLFVTVQSAFNTLTSLYVVPGSVDAEIQIRVCNIDGGDANFWVAFKTPTMVAPAYIEFNSAICGYGSPDVFEAPKWVPPGTEVWVKSDSGLIQFSVIGSETGRAGVTFTQ